MSAERELAILITARDLASRGIKGVKGELRKLESVAATAGRSVGRELERAAAVGSAAAVGAIGFAIKAAMDWETAVAGVAKTVDGDISTITAAILDMSAKIPVAATELAGIAEAGGALGVAKKDILGFTEVVALLGVTTDLTSATAATALGHLRTTLGLTGQDFRALGDELVYLGNHGASTESQILAMAESIAGAAGIMGATKEQVLGWAAAVANTGEEAEAGGSSIQRFWLASTTAVSKGGAKLKLMAKISGESVAQFKRDFGKDATGTLAKFITHLGKLSKAEQLAALEKLGFTDIRVQRALLKLVGNTDNLTTSLTDATTAAGAMGAEAAKRFATTASQIAILKNNVLLAAIAIGDQLLPMVTELSKDTVGWIQSHGPEIKAFGRDLATGIRGAVEWAQKLDWKAIGEGLKGAAQGATTIRDMFLGLPDWVKTAVVTGWGLNKLTGGAVIDFGKLMFGRGMTPATPLYVANVGAGGVGGVVPGGGAGLLGTLSSLAMKVTIVGIAAEVAQAIHGPGNLDPSLPMNNLAWPWGSRNTPDINWGPLTHILGGDSGTPRDPLSVPGQGNGYVPGSADEPPVLAELRHERQVATAADEQNRRVVEEAGRDGLRASDFIAAAVTRAGADTTRTVRDTTGTLGQITRTTGARTYEGAVGTTRAINAKDLSVTVDNTTNVTVQAKISAREVTASVVRTQSHAKAI